MDLQLAVQIQQWQRPLDSCATCPEAHQKCLIAKQPASLRAALPCLCCFLSTFLLLLRGVSQEREVVKNWWTRPTNSTGWTKTRVKPLTKRDVHPQFWFGDYPIAVYIYIYPVLLPCWWFYGFVWKSRPPKVDALWSSSHQNSEKRGYLPCTNFFWIS